MNLAQQTSTSQTQSLRKLRRIVLIGVGLLELSTAAVLVALIFVLPSDDAVIRGFRQAEQITTAGKQQVGLLQSQTADLSRPQVHRDLLAVAGQTRQVSQLLQNQQVDYQAAAILQEALGEVADGLEELAGELDPRAANRLGQGLGATADFLDQQLAPAAQQAARAIEQATDELSSSAEQLRAVASSGPLSLEPVQRIHESLKTFDQGLDRLGAALEPEFAARLSSATDDLKSVVNEGARLARKASGYTYPTNFRLERKGRLGIPSPTWERASFWPEGRQVARHLEGVGESMAEAGKRFEQLGKDLPAIRRAVLASRAVVAETRGGLAQALEHRETLEPVLKSLPQQASQLATKLPQVGGDLANLLRATHQLQGVAEALRTSQQRLEASTRRWPSLQRTMVNSASVLRSLQNQLKMALHDQDELQAAQQEASRLAEAFSQTLTALSADLSTRLQEQDQALAHLEQGFHQAEQTLPNYGRSLALAASLGRWLAGLVAGIALLHGSLLISEPFRKPN